MSNFLTEITCVWGCRGSGKTTLAKKLVMEARPAQLLTIDPMANGENTVSHPSVVAERLQNGESVVCNGRTREERLGALYAAFLISSPARPIYALCDEAPAYLDRFTDALNTIIFQGRHAGFGMCIIGQRPAAVDANIRSQAAQTYWLRLTDHVDISTAQKSIGPENSANLRNFTPGQYLRHV